MSKIVIVMDCGATNVRSIAVDEKGNLLASHSHPNEPSVYDGMKIWDVDVIWNKLLVSTKEVVSKINKDDIVGVTVTTFGVDGAAMKKDGSMLYPVISWQCERTIPVMKNISKYISLEKLYEISALTPMHFNTISKIAWLRENMPSVLDDMDYYVLISSIFLYRLSGVFCTDTSQAGTTMLTDAKTRDFSNEILSAFGIAKEDFPPLVEPGTAVGEVTAKASEETGIPKGVKVVAAGHDTQFAIFGSGAKENECVLSSGTWEILMVRAKTFVNDALSLKKGLTTEFDASKGLYNMGAQWIASGALEWFTKMFYGEEKKAGNVYDIMINEAKKVEPGCAGVFVHPAFTPGIGPSAPYNTHGTFMGLTLGTERGALYRAMLESLACQLKEGLSILEEAANFKAKSVVVVGGGSKNTLWNQIRADVLGIPVKLIEQKETTVLGGALFALAGAGVYKNADEARTLIDYKGEEFTPSSQHDKYDEVYKRFLSLPKGLSFAYEES